MDTAAIADRDALHSMREGTVAAAAKEGAAAQAGSSSPVLGASAAAASVTVKLKSPYNIFPPKSEGGSARNQMTLEVGVASTILGLKQAVAEKCRRWSAEVSEVLGAKDQRIIYGGKLQRDSAELSTVLGEARGRAKGKGRNKKHVVGLGKES